MRRYLILSAMVLSMGGVERQASAVDRSHAMDRQAPAIDQASKALGSYRTILMPNAGLPLTTFNLTFRVGSADDPKNFEGLAHLTALLLREGGVSAWAGLGAGHGMAARTRAELEDFLFPLAGEIGVSIAKEQISFQVTASVTDAETVFAVLAQMVLAPAFDATEFKRLQSETLDELTKQYPREDQEELGKAALDMRIFGAGHPYAHVVAGTISGVKSASVEKVREFYKRAFTQRRLTLGIAGVVTPQLEQEAKSVFSALPLGDADRAPMPPLPRPDGVRLLLVKGPFDAVGVHLGHAVRFNRASPEFPQMYLASMAFGKHRSFVGRLMRVVREIRGLNYGTYSYVEDFPGGGSRLVEPTQVARAQQAFTVWGRPTPLPNGCFLLRQVYREVKSLAESGLTDAEFELTKSHLVGNAPLLGADLERRLGYAIDSAFYGIPGDYLKELQSAAKRAKRAEVNRLLQAQIDPDHLQIVVVTPEPEKFKEEILGMECPIQYGAGIQKPEDVLAEDLKISRAHLPLSADRIEIVTAESLFEK